MTAAITRRCCAARWRCRGGIGSRRNAYAPARRAAGVGGNAVALAARALRAKCVRLAAQALGVAEDEVQQHGKVFADRGKASRSVDLGRLTSAAAIATAAHGVAPGLEATHYF